MWLQISTATQLSSNLWIVFELVISFLHVVRVWTIVVEMIDVGMSQLYVNHYRAYLCGEKSTILLLGSFVCGQFYLPW